MQVRYCNVECQKMAWEQGSHKKMCKLYRKKQANVGDGQDPKASADQTKEMTERQKVES